MKKILFSIMIVMLSAILAICASAATYKKGDANMDGKVNASDARLVLRASATLDKFTDAQIRICDMNNDGFIKAADARLVLRVAARLDINTDSVTIGDSSADSSSKTELSGSIGTSFSSFMKTYGNLKKLNTNNNTVAYGNNSVTVSSDPKIINTGNISSINITDGKYTLCGVSAGMSYSDALSTLKNAKWVSSKETKSQAVLTKNGMKITLSISDKTVKSVEYAFASSINQTETTTSQEPTTKPQESTTVKPETTTKPQVPTTSKPETTTKPQESATSKPETTTKPQVPTTKPQESTTKPSAKPQEPITNEAFKKLPAQAQAYLLGNFGFEGYNYNKDKKEPITMYITKDNIRVSMPMEISEGNTIPMDVLIKNLQGNTKVYLIDPSTKKFCDASYMGFDVNDINMNSNFTDMSKTVITQKTEKEGIQTFTVYNIKSETESCDIYMIGNEIKRIYNYDSAGLMINRIDVDKFYETVPDSVFSLNNHKNVDLLEFFVSFM